MLKNKRLLFITLILISAALVVLGLKLGYPGHRAIALVLLALGWIPLVMSYRINKRVIKVHKRAVERRVEPFKPHMIAALVLSVVFYVTWILFPVERSPLLDLTKEELRAEMGSDYGSYLMLRKTADDIVERFMENDLLQRSVGTLSRAERETIRELWREGVMTFVEFDLLKQKYRGFYQLDYVADPALHADAFLLAYMSDIAQYHACLKIMELVEANEFMETLLDEEGDGIPYDSYYMMKEHLTDPGVLLRVNAGAAYFELIQNDVSLPVDAIIDFETRCKDCFWRLGAHAEMFVDHPLDILERKTFQALLPIQKRVALKMSSIRTAKREYLITPELIAEHQSSMEPGDILLERRNWHMTNIGIPGFWPHVALYVGTPREMAVYFSELGFDPLERIKALYPEVYNKLGQKDETGEPFRVIEAIRPGVVLQSLATSARCDYFCVVRPRISKAEKFKALLAAFSYYGKPYDLNFDFTTDNELVCSELVYKAFKATESMPFEAGTINGRLLLPPNQMAGQMVEGLGAHGTFSFVLFLDAIEHEQRVVERNVAAFRASCSRPKWDIFQE